MKTRLLGALVVGWLCAYASAADNDRRAGIDIDAETSLDEAVTRFNAQVYRLSRIGREQPPLTADEVVASIRAWNIESTPVEPELLAVFQEMAETRKLPPGSQLDFTTSLEGKQWQITVWWVDISVTAPHPSKEGSFVGYSYRIRDRKLSSRRVEPDPSDATADDVLSTHEIQRHVARHYESIGFVSRDTKD